MQSCYFPSCCQCFLFPNAPTIILHHTARLYLGSGICLREVCGARVYNGRDLVLASLPESQA